jgi:eukaryotic-like serine/threonine-protein kinase
MPAMDYDDDDAPPVRRMQSDGGRPVLAAFLTSLITTAVVFVGLLAAERRGMFEFLRPVGRDVEVPSITGVSVEQARDLLKSRGLLLSLQAEQPHPSIPVGKLASQVPLPGSRAPRGSSIEGFVSSGAGAIPIPSLTGVPPETAVEQLRQRKLVPGHRRQAASDKVAAGLVIGSDPEEGTSVKPDTMVSLIVSTGPAAKPVPKVVGQRLSRAKKSLEEAGFKVGSTRYGSNDHYDVDVIIKQDPAENTPAAPGSAVNLIINE